MAARGHDRAAVGLTAGSSPSNGTEIFDTVIGNGRVMDPESELDAVRSVGIRGGKIAAIRAVLLKGNRRLMRRDSLLRPDSLICMNTAKTLETTSFRRTTA